MGTGLRMIPIKGAVPESGYSWRVELPDEVPDGDGPDWPPRSILRLFENGVEIGPGYALHDEIRGCGGGRYSHWGRNLYFSTSDNSSPIENGRLYAIPVNWVNDGTRLTDEIAQEMSVQFKRRIHDDVEYAVQLTNSYLGQLSVAGLNIKGLRILELGPGVNFAPQLVLSSMGASVAVADRFIVPWNNNYHVSFYREFRERWAAELPAIDRVLRDCAYSPEAISIFANPAENLVDIPPAAFDLIISNAVLEHIYSMRAVCREMARITAPRGFNMHQVDFRDHNDFAQPLEFLIISDQEYDSQFGQSNGKRGNRLRPSETRFLFEKEGFEHLSFDVDRRCDVSYLESFLPRLRIASSRYRDWPTEELDILSGRMVFRKSG